MTRGRFAEAHTQFDAGLEIDPLVQTGARSNSVIAWLLQRRYADARRVVDSMLALNPNSASAWAFVLDRAGGGQLPGPAEGPGRVVEPGSFG